MRSFLSPYTKVKRRLKYLSIIYISYIYYNLPRPTTKKALIYAKISLRYTNHEQATLCRTMLLFFHFFPSSKQKGRVLNVLNCDSSLKSLQAKSIAKNGASQIFFLFRKWTTRVFDKCQKFVHPGTMGRRRLIFRIMNFLRAYIM